MTHDTPDTQAEQTETDGPSEEALPTANTRRRTNASPPEEADVIVVGIGTAGLVAAAYLAKSGFKVACFDSHYVAGGCATQFARGERGERYHFDIGLHYIGDCGEKAKIPTILEAVGVQQDFLPMDKDGFDVFLFPDLRFPMPVGIEAFRQRLLSFFPEEKAGIDRYIRFLTEIDEAGMRLERQWGKMTLGTLWYILWNVRLLLRYQYKTIGEFLDTCTKNPRLRAVLIGQHGDYALPPSEVSAVLHAGLTIHYLRGAYYPKGGGQAISDKLADAIEASGGSIHLRRGIEKILIEEGRVVGVRTESRKGESRTIRAPIVVSGADYKKTLLGLIGPEHLPSAWLQRAKDGKMAEALFSTYLGIKGDMRERGMTSANYWLFDSYDTEEAYRRLRNSPEVEAFGAYITSASIKDSMQGHHAPEGVQTVEVMTVTTGDAKRWGVSPEEIQTWKYRKNPRYNAIKQRIEDEMIQRLDRVFPGASASIVYQESSTPITHSRYTRASDGTSYGLAATPGQFLKNRPSYRTPIEGLYLCGVSTRAGHGISGAMEGGFAAARCIAKDHHRPFHGRPPHS